MTSDIISKDIDKIFDKFSLCGNLLCIKRSETLQFPLLKNMIDSDLKGNLIDDIYYITLDMSYFMCVYNFVILDIQPEKEDYDTFNKIYKYIFCGKDFNDELFSVHNEEPNSEFISERVFKELSKIIIFDSPYQDTNKIKKNEKFKNIAFDLFQKDTAISVKYTGKIYLHSTVEGELNLYTTFGKHTTKINNYNAVYHKKIREIISNCINNKCEGILLDKNITKMVDCDYIFNKYYEALIEYINEKMRSKFK
jgi:hypothetical protein